MCGRLQRLETKGASTCSRRYGIPSHYTGVPSVELAHAVIHCASRKMKEDSAQCLVSRLTDQIVFVQLMGRVVITRTKYDVKYVCVVFVFRGNHCHRRDSQSFGIVAGWEEEFEKHTPKIPMGITPCLVTI